MSGNEGSWGSFSKPRIEFLAYFWVFFLLIKYYIE